MLDPRVRLILLTGSRVGEELEVRGEAVLGRLAECDLRLEEKGVSRRHATVRIEGGDAWVRDLGSANGTKVGGRRVQQARLSDGDVVEMGLAKVRVRVERPAQAGDDGLGVDESEPEPRPEPVVRPSPGAAPTRPAPAGGGERRGRGGALQYHRVEDRGGLLSSDLGQSAWPARWIAILIVVAVGALVFWLAYTQL